MNISYLVDSPTPQALEYTQHGTPTLFRYGKGKGPVIPPKNVQSVANQHIPRATCSPAVIEILDDSSERSRDIVEVRSPTQNSHNTKTTTLTEHFKNIQNNVTKNDRTDPLHPYPASTQTATQEVKSNETKACSPASPPQDHGYGIANPGTYCYLNSVIQAFRFAVIQNNFLPCEQDNHADSIDGKAARVRSELNKLTQTLNHRTVTKEEISQFLDFLRTNTVLPKDWGTGQEDTVELCNHLLKALKTKKIQYAPIQKEGRRAHDSTYIPAYTAVGPSMQDTIQSGEFRFKKDSLPDVLPIHLKRYLFSHAKGIQKLEPVEPTQKIFLPLAKGGTAEYELVSVVVHTTNSEGPARGHYYTYVMQKDNSFILYNDSIVEKEDSAKREITEDGCLYFYRRMINDNPITSNSPTKPRAINAESSPNKMPIQAQKEVEKKPNQNQFIEIE